MEDKTLKGIFRNESEIKISKEGPFPAKTLLSKKGRTNSKRKNRKTSSWRKNRSPFAQGRKPAGILHKGKGHPVPRRRRRERNPTRYLYVRPKERKTWHPQRNRKTNHNTAYSHQLFSRFLQKGNYP